MSKATWLLLFAACSKPAAHVDLDASLPDATAITETPPEPLFPPPPAGEAKRYSIATLEAEPLLAPALPEAKKHFGSGPFVVQSAELSKGKTALLVSLADGSQPYLAVVADKKLAWSHDRPTAGIMPPVLYATIAAHSRGGVVMVAYDPPTHILMARVWDDDGTPFADFQLLEATDCSAVSAATWPGVGLFVVASLSSGARAQLLTDEGMMSFPHAGLSVGGAWRTPTPVTIIVDTPKTVMLVMHGKSKIAADRILLQRFDAAGGNRWPDPVGVDVTKVAKPGERIDASLVREGVVHVTMPDGEWGRALEVDSTGHIVRLSK